MSNVSVYITYSEEVRRALAAADPDFLRLLRDELSSAGVASAVDWAPDPTKGDDQERDLVLLILAGAAAVTLVGGTVARVIDAITKRKAAISEERNLEVALDGRGNPIRDKAGNPVFNITTKPAPFPPSGTTKISVEAAKLLKIDFGTS